MNQSWEDFVSRCRSCRDCGLAETRTNVVVSRGSERAPLFLLGEAPGAQEDLQGQPFVGRSGQLLNRLLREAGFPEDSYHIGNVLKCRPPKNRVPTQEERQACRRLLEEQFALVGAKVVVLLGSTAFRGFTGQNTPITEMRGEWMQPEQGLWVLPTFHPAYVLRRPSQASILLEDLRKVHKQMMEQGWLS